MIDKSIRQNIVHILFDYEDDLSDGYKWYCGYDNARKERDENVEAKKVEDKKVVNKPLIKASKPKVNIKPQTIESKVVKEIKPEIRPAPIYIMLRPPVIIEN